RTLAQQTQIKFSNIFTSPERSPVESEREWPLRVAAVNHAGRKTRVGPCLCGGVITIMVPRALRICMGILLAAGSLATAAETHITPPTVFLQQHHEHLPVTYSNPISLKDGTLIRYGVGRRKNRLHSQTSNDGGRSWGEEKFECELLPGTYMVLPLLSRDGEIHLASMVGRGDGREIAVDRFIDIWHQRTTGKRTNWEEPNVIFEGYCGALIDFKQLSTGRLVCPFAWWVPKRPCAPPVGANLSTVFYSDDGGRTWTKSKSDLSSPCYPNFVGNNYGADEPCVLELKDGRLWMLMRTQTGFLYESFSSDQGETWSDAQPSRFVSSSSPPMLWRMPDDRIIALWNNCESPPAHEGAGVYVNRDALHAAVSGDEGKTWRGFREVYRDPHESETPPNTDHGSAYPTPPVWAKGRFVFLTGQGAGRRNLVSVDPRWLTLTHAEDDFSDGLSQWIAFKPIGSAHRYLRKRIPGASLIEHPTKADARVLHLGKPDVHDADGALWNFPNSVTGKLTLRLMPNPGFGGASISLNDRSFKPTDDNSERLAVFAATIEPDGKLGGGRQLSLGEWHTFVLTWDLKAQTCTVSVDGAETLALKQRNAAGNGISYLHLRSKATEVNASGFYVESASVDVADPVAPALTDQQKRSLLDSYIPSYRKVTPQTRL
ncbi:MAG: sialidase family protein, partial [Pirellulales bacterium]